MTGTIDGDAEHALLTSIMAQMVTATGQVVGAAFAVGPDLLVTSAHVVTGFARLVPLDVDTPVDFEVVATFAEVDDVMPKLAPWPDLAVLRVIGDHRFAQWATLADRLPHLPADVRMVGFPKAGGATGLSTLTVGIDSVGGVQSTPTLRLVDAQVEGGASGGPLVDPTRRAAVGVVLASKDPKQAHGGFAVALATLRSRWPAEAGPWPSPPPAEAWAQAYPDAAAWVPPAIVRLPKRGNAPHFVRRPALLAHLEQAGDETTVIRALGGSGGVGKSELALYWARRCVASGQYAVVCWIDATTEASTHAGLVALAADLQIEPGADLAATSTVVDTALARLDQRWLVVFDNADTLDHLAGNLPTAGGGMALVTTRSTTAGAEVDAVVVDVDVFDPDEAVGFLLEAVSTADPAAAASVADRLGFLPLALAQAAAFMNERSMSLAAYDALIAEDLPRGLEASAARHERTVATLWDHIWPRLSAEGLAVLARASLLAPKAIPVEALGTDTMSAEDVAQALREAARYRVVTITDGPTGLDTVDMHQLTQLACAPSTKELDATVEAVVARLVELTAPVDATHPDSWPIWERLEPHVTALYAGAASPDSPLLHLIDRQATYRQYCGLNHDAIPLFENVLEDSVAFGDGNGLDVVRARSNLALAYSQAGRIAEAIELQAAVLATIERTLGPDHLTTMKSRANLAGSFWRAGRTDEAIELYEEVRSASERTLGPSHPNTIQACANLAVAYKQAGRIAEAIDLEEALLPDSQRILGPDHPHAIVCRANLASSYTHVGRFDEAIDLQEAVLTDSQRVLGPDHPTTIMSRANLAVSYQRTGRIAEAIDLEEAVITDFEQILGRDHPNTINSGANLAASYMRAERTTEGLDLMEAAVADSRRILGPDHPDTLGRTRVLAQWRSELT